MVLCIAYIFDKLFETIIFILTYGLIRCDFTKMIHGSDFTKSAHKGIIYCRIITFLVQTISIIFIFKINISKYINLILAFLLGVINYIGKCFIEKCVKKTIFYKGMKIDELPKDLKGIEYEIIYQYYVKRYKLGYIAYNLNYSIDNIKKIKSKILKRYS